MLGAHIRPFSFEASQAGVVPMASRRTFSEADRTLRVLLVEDDDAALVVREALDAPEPTRPVRLGLL